MICNRKIRILIFREAEKGQLILKMYILVFGSKCSLKYCIVEINEGVVTSYKEKNQLHPATSKNISLVIVEGYFNTVVTHLVSGKSNKNIFQRDEKDTGAWQPLLGVDVVTVVELQSSRLEREKEKTESDKNVYILLTFLSAQ